MGQSTGTLGAQLESHGALRKDNPLIGFDGAQVVDVADVDNQRAARDVAAQLEDLATRIGLRHSPDPPPVKGAEVPEPHGVGGDVPPLVVLLVALAARLLRRGRYHGA